MPVLSTRQLFSKKKAPEIDPFLYFLRMKTYIAIIPPKKSRQSNHSDNIHFYISFIFCDNLQCNTLFLTDIMSQALCSAFVLSHSSIAKLRDICYTAALPSIAARQSPDVDIISLQCAHFNLFPQGCGLTKRLAPSMR